MVQDPKIGSTSPRPPSIPDSTQRRAAQWTGRASSREHELCTAWQLAGGEGKKEMDRDSKPLHRRGSAQLSAPILWLKPHQTLPTCP